MKGKEDAISGVLFILLGLAFLAMSWSFPKGSQDGVPGPGYFPIVISIFLIALSLLMIVIGFVEKTSFNFFDELFKVNLTTFLLTNVAIIGYLVLWSVIPFVLNTIVFLIALGMIFRRGLKANIVFSITVSVAIYLLFGHVFHVML
jgi:putative tricarboxylic transport membrane protein